MWLTGLNLANFVVRAKLGSLGQIGGLMWNLFTHKKTVPHSIGLESGHSFTLVGLVDSLDCWIQKSFNPPRFSSAI